MVKFWRHDYRNRALIFYAQYYAPRSGVTIGVQYVP